MITFGGLVGLMVAGEGGDTLRGTIREVDGGIEHVRRVFRRGALVRVEDPDGQVSRIVGRDDDWYRSDEGGVIHRPGRTGYADGMVIVEAGDGMFAERPIGGLEVGGERPSWGRWVGNDFTHPTGPPEDTEFLGRPAYVLELAPPSHKPYPLQLTVDADTGIVLRNANRDFGSATEWIELDLDVELPDDLFVWTGPVTETPTHEEMLVDFEAEVAELRDRVTARGIEVELPSVPLDLMVHEWDEDSGALYASLERSFDGALLRRPRSSDPWAEPDGISYPAMYRWSDERWD